MHRSERGGPAAKLLPNQTLTITHWNKRLIESSFRDGRRCRLRSHPLHWLRPPCKAGRIRSCLTWSFHAAGIERSRRVLTFQCMAWPNPCVMCPRCYSIILSAHSPYRQVTLRWRNHACQGCYGSVQTKLAASVPPGQCSLRNERPLGIHEAQNFALGIRM